MLDYVKSIEPGIIRFTIDELENDNIAVLDLK